MRTTIWTPQRLSASSISGDKRSDGVLFFVSYYEYEARETKSIMTELRSSIHEFEWLENANGSSIKPLCSK